MEIIFDLEASDIEAAFFGIYAGLRMYMEQKSAAPKDGPDAFFISAAETYCRLEELKVQHPEQYRNAENEYNEVYGKVTRSLALADQ